MSTNYLLLILYHDTAVTQRGNSSGKIIPVISSLFIAFIDTDIEFDITEINFDIDRIFCIPQGHVFFPDC